MELHPEAQELLEPPGYITRITPGRVGGVGPWAS